MEMRIGDKIDILYDEKYYKSDIQDVTKNNICIRVPLSEGQYILPPIGRNVEVLLYNKKCVYKFICKVVNRTNDEIPMLYLSKPDDFKKVQRRKYVRVSYVNYLKYAVTTNNFNTISYNKSILNDLKKCILLDMSGGGVKIKTTQELKKGNILAMMMPLDEGDTLFKGEVVRAVKDDDGMYECGIQFIDLSESEREKIISYIFKVMRSQMKRS